MNNKFFTINFWFYLFIVLLAAVVLSLLTVNQWLTPTDVKQPETEKMTKTKSQLVLSPEVVNRFIQQDNTKSMKLKLSDRYIHIHQRSKFLGKAIDTNILTTPVVIGHNKLQLNIEDVSVAGLPLSKKRTLSLIQHFGDLPENVVLDVDKSCFYYKMESINMAGTTLELNAVDSSGWHFDIDL